MSDRIMPTEPRGVGKAILDAAAGWHFALRKCSHDEAFACLDALDALAERAEAAERVAQAADALGWTDAAAWMEGADEFKAALEAWRGVDRG